MRPDEGLRRVIIEGVEPEVDCGRFPAKGVIGDPLVVEADVFTDGHDALSCILLHRRAGQRNWREVPMQALPNDRWRASFRPTELGLHHFTIEGWVDPFKTWRRDMEKRVQAGQDLDVDLRIGADLLEQAAARANRPDGRQLRKAAETLRGTMPQDLRAQHGLDMNLAELVTRYPERGNSTKYDKELRVWVDRERARFSAWYEMFPRSASAEPGRAGTFRDVEERLPYVAGMGFDVLYLPPIHPIGRVRRKGPNNREIGEEGDLGSPWAIGAEEGGHKAIHPELGTMEDFERLVRSALAQGMEVALDIAFQAAPDHPYVREHPEWFRERPDGTIQYAENPPKKYQDIYPFNFESKAWRDLWDELKDVIDFWIEHGVRIFRIDNPHTKPFTFWEWLIGEVRARHPEVIFLSEAFTRPKVMYRLAKLGFTQSYTYFAWRNERWELEEYLTELTRGEPRHFFRPNFWPNTPDILTEALQTGGPPVFAMRLVLAATLTASYGIYGPPFELMEHIPREPGSEEYLNSEKYEVRHWDLDREDSLRELITAVNRIRRENPALQHDHNLEFVNIENPQMIAYTKTTDDLSNLVLTVVNLEPRYIHSGWLDLPLEDLGIDPARPYLVEDLLTGSRFQWRGPVNYVELRPTPVPAHIFRIVHPAGVATPTAPAA